MQNCQTRIICCDPVGNRWPTAERTPCGQSTNKARLLSMGCHQRPRIMRSAARPLVLPPIDASRPENECDVPHLRSAVFSPDLTDFILRSPSGVVSAVEPRRNVVCLLRQSSNGETKGNTGVSSTRSARAWANLFHQPFRPLVQPLRSGYRRELV